MTDKPELLAVTAKIPPWVYAVGIAPLLALGGIYGKRDPEDQFIEMDDEEFFDLMDDTMGFIAGLYSNRGCQIQDREVDADALVQCDEHHPTWRLRGLV